MGEFQGEHECAQRCLLVAARREAAPMSAYPDRRAGPDQCPCAAGEHAQECTGRQRRVNSPPVAPLARRIPVARGFRTVNAASRIRGRVPSKANERAPFRFPAAAGTEWPGRRPRRTPGWWRPVAATHLVPRPGCAASAIRTRRRQVLRPARTRWPRSGRPGVSHRRHHVRGMGAEHGPGDGRGGRRADQRGDHVDHRSGAKQHLQGEQGPTQGHVVDRGQTGAGSAREQRPPPRAVQPQPTWPPPLRARHRPDVAPPPAPATPRNRPPESEPRHQRQRSLTATPGRGRPERFPHSPPGAPSAAAPTRRSRPPRRRWPSRSPAAVARPVRPPAGRCSRYNRTPDALLVGIPVLLLKVVGNPWSGVHEMFKAGNMTDQGVLDILAVIALGAAAVAWLQFTAAFIAEFASVRRAVKYGRRPARPRHLPLVLTSQSRLAHSLVTALLLIGPALFSAVGPGATAAFAAAPMPAATSSATAGVPSHAAVDHRTPRDQYTRCNRREDPRQGIDDPGHRDQQRTSDLVGKDGPGSFTGISFGRSSFINRSMRCSLSNRCSGSLGVQRSPIFGGEVRRRFRL